MDTPTLRSMHTLLSLLLLQAQKVRASLDTRPAEAMTVTEIMQSAKENGRILGLLDACTIVEDELARELDVIEKALDKLGVPR